MVKRAPTAVDERPPAEDLPPAADLRGLRRSYIAAIAASREAEARFVERRQARDSRKPERDSLHWQMGQAQLYITPATPAEGGPE